MPPLIPPLRGEVWQYVPELSRGREQTGERPGIILSTNSFNRSGWELVVIVPITSTPRGYPAHVPVPFGSPSGLNRPSFALCDQLQSISQDRLLWRRGEVEHITLQAMEQAVRVVLGL